MILSKKDIENSIREKITMIHIREMALEILEKGYQAGYNDGMESEREKQRQKSDAIFHEKKEGV